MPDVDSLTAEEQVKVFWLQQHLFEEGLDGIFFSERIKTYLHTEGKGDIEDDMEKLLSGRQF